MFKDIVKPAVILFLICALITGALAYVNGVTDPIIKESENRALQEGLKKVLPGAESFSKQLPANELKASGYAASDRIVGVYEAKTGGEAFGYVVEVASKGYGGAIKMLVGIDMDMNIKGVMITGHNETPGLGSKASEESFTAQYLGKAREFEVVKGKAKADGEIQAISGATITTRAVTHGVADAAEVVRSMTGGVE